jgi:SAM-dependent methyltransferase
VGKPEIPKTEYSQIAKYYDRVRATPTDILSSKIVEYGEIGAGCVVLDVGCGTGRFPLQISSEKEGLFCALEPSIEMLREAAAKNKSKSIFWVRGDGQKLPFRDNVFDCVYMTMVLHHVEDKETALREIYRTLKKNSNCVIMTTSHSRIRKHVLNDFPGVTAMDLKRFPTVPSLKKAITKIGFRDVHYHPVQYSEDVSTNEYLEKVRNKYISTLTLLGEDSFSERI